MNGRPLYDPDSLDNRDPKAIDRLLAKIDPILERFFQPSVRGLSRIPAGPALYVENHNAGLLMPDAWAVASAIYRECGLEALPYALAHDLALRPPALNRALCPLGAVRANKDTAARVFAAGHKALVFPGGDLEVLRPFAKRDQIVFGPRRGYIKLALRSGVPIIPIVTAGAHSGFVVLDDGQKLARALRLPKWARVNVFPTVLSFPWGLTFGFPPPYVPVPTRMYSEVLAPIHFGRSGEVAADDDDYVERCHERVVAAMQGTLDRLARERREDRRHRVATRALDLFERALASVGLTTQPTVDDPAFDPLEGSGTVVDVAHMRGEKHGEVVRLADHRAAA
jgi:1-acyl-sn-glycerol-3-phosphate acyltransferase